MEAELNLDPDSNPNPNPESDQELITDPDPNLQIISDPAGSGSTTLGRTVQSELDRQKLKGKIGQAEQGC